MERVTQLLISGITSGIDESTLKRYLAPIVKFRSLEIIRDLDKDESLGYAVLRTTEDVVEEVVGKIEAIRLGNRQLHATIMPITLPGEMALRDWLHRHAESVLRSIGIKLGVKVLDYGCGPGIFTIPCAKIVGTQGLVYALDVRGKVLERVKQIAADSELNNIQTILQNPGATSIPLSNDSLDVVYIFDVMHDIKDKPALLKEANRVLKANGFVSVFPMHMGDETILGLIDEIDIFILRDKFSPRNSKSPSSILNFEKK